MMRSVRRSGDCFFPAVGIHASEPVDEEDLGEFLGVGLGADLEPVVEVVGHVVSAEGEHGHWAEGQFAFLACYVPGLDQIS